MSGTTRVAHEMFMAVCIKLFIKASLIKMPIIVNCLNIQQFGFCKILNGLLRLKHHEQKKKKPAIVEIYKNVTMKIWQVCII